METHIGGGSTSNIIIVSNRLPIKVEGDGTVSVTTGGLGAFPSQKS